MRIYQLEWREGVGRSTQEGEQVGISISLFLYFSQPSTQRNTQPAHSSPISGHEQTKQ